MQVRSTNSLPILASERVIHYYNGINTSFYEMLGLPKEALSTEYWFPFYNNVSVNTQLRIANVNAVGTPSATVQLYIAGSPVGSPYTVAPGTIVPVNLAGVSNGPVRVESTNGVKIISTERVIFAADGVHPSSFSETMGLPKEQLSTEYWFPFYNNVSINTQLRIANVNAAGTPSANVQLYIAGSPVGSPYTVAPGTIVPVSLAGVSKGPVRVLRAPMG